jgi:PTH1 family peptidyl-tRNA hydrolase
VSLRQRARRRVAVDPPEHVLVGLGNPGPEFADTRHNVGWMIVDRLALKYSIELNEMRFAARYGIGNVSGRQVLIACPTTYMNRSGDAVAFLLRHYGVGHERLLVTVDDIDLPLGYIRLRARGSAAGHRGLEHVLYRMHSNSVPRMRFGVGRPVGSTGAAAHVLRPFEPDELPIVEASLDRAVAGVELYFSDGIDAAMNALGASNARPARI